MTFSLIDVTLISTVALGALTDLMTKKVYNALTLPLAIFGIAFHLSQSGLSGGAFALMGLGCGLALYLPLCLAGMMGAGDVKLLAAIGALAGWQTAVNVGFYAIIVGGLFALSILCVRGKFFLWLSSMKRFLISFLIPGCPLVLPDLKECHWMPFAPALFLALVGVVSGFLTPLL